MKLFRLGFIFLCGSILLINAQYAHAQFTPITMLKYTAPVVTACTGSVGTICADGSVIVGTSPDGNVTMYAARCAIGQTWTGSACSGSAAGTYWNNGNSTVNTPGTGDDTLLANCASNPPSGTGTCLSGNINSYLLATTYDADVSTAGTQNHLGAKACEDSTAHGLTDWYLPSVRELYVLLLNYGTLTTGSPAPMPGLTNATNYQSSSEAGYNVYYALQSNQNNPYTPQIYSAQSKNTLFNVLCVRTNQDYTPNAFTFTDVPSPTLGQTYDSNIVTLSGLDGPNAIDVEYTGFGGTAQISKNGGAFGTSAITVVNGDTIQLRMTASSDLQGRYVSVRVGRVTDEWNIGSTCASSSGRVCTDGTVYVGLTPDNNIPMYTMRCPIGQTWSGTTCTGSATTYMWNNGNTQVSGDDTPLANCTTAPPSGTGTCLTGKFNSAMLNTYDSDVSTAGTQNHLAAKACEDLTIHGQSDWYLPSARELYLLMSSYGSLRNSMGGFVNGQSMHSSSENSNTSVYILQTNTNSPYTPQVFTGTKNNAYPIFCTRTDQDITPNAFSFTDVTSPTASTLYSSNVVTLTGITGPGVVDVTITGVGGTAQIRKNGGTYVNGPITVVEGDTIQLQMTSSSNGQGRYVTVQVGTVQDDWNLGPACTAVEGSVCSDNTVFAGISPDGNVPMYIPRCAYGQTWTGSVCNNSAATRRWNAGANGDNVAALADCASTPPSGTGTCLTGKSNSALLITVDSDASTGGFQDHEAAKACEDLTDHAYTDWYLPSARELYIILSSINLLSTNAPGINVNGRLYFSSSETSNQMAYGAQSNTNSPYTPTNYTSVGKNQSYYVYCARR